MSNQNIYSNSHHCIPTSIGGSDDDINVVDDVLKLIHGNYHHWGNNRTPCMNIRLASLNSIGGDFGIPTEPLKDIVEITTMFRWSELYDPRAFAHVADPCSIKRAFRSANFQLTHWLEELVLVRKQISALFNGGHFTVKDGGREIQNYMIASMRENNLQSALLTMLTEQQHKKYVWVNPMKELTRTDLEKAVKNSKPTESLQHHKNAYEELLHTQEQKLAEFVEKKRGEIQAILSMNPSNGS
ncbi:hypothetical protein KKF55_05315 [Patescibacteria group bacterium]|nr:hypothetical protein [Patescibacteria group bacterium]